MAGARAAPTLPRTARRTGTAAPAAAMRRGSRARMRASTPARKRRRRRRRVAWARAARRHEERALALKRDDDALTDMLHCPAQLSLSDAIASVTRRAKGQLVQRGNSIILLIAIIQINLKMRVEGRGSSGFGRETRGAIVVKNTLFLAPVETAPQLGRTCRAEGARPRLLERRAVAAPRTHVIASRRQLATCARGDDATPRSESVPCADLDVRALDGRREARGSSGQPLAVHARRNAALPGAHAVTQDSIACWHSAFFSAYTRLGRSPARRGQHQRRCER